MSQLEDFLAGISQRDGWAACIAGLEHVRTMPCPARRHPGVLPRLSGLPPAAVLARQARGLTTQRAPQAGYRNPLHLGVRPPTEDLLRTLGMKLSERKKARVLARIPFGSSRS